MGGFVDGLVGKKENENWVGLCFSISERHATTSKSFWLPGAPAAAGRNI